MLTDIPEVVGFLQDRAPAVLDALRSKYKTSAESKLLVVGSSMGGNPADVLAEVKCVATLAALETAAPLAQAMVTQTLKRLHHANIWEVICTLLSVIGSSTALAVLWPSGATKDIAQWASAAGLIGAVAALAPKTLRKTFFGTADGVAKLLVEAQDIEGRAEMILPVLRQAVKDTTLLGLEEVKVAIRDGVVLITRIRQIKIELT